MPILMKKFLSKHSQLLLTLVFGICVFIFWRMRYPFALNYQEQLQLFLFDGDYFKVKQLQLGYTIPANITKKVAISNLRLYVSLDDFFTITSYPGLDPETASTNNFSGAGLDWGSYPTMKKLILGVNVTF